MVLTKFCYTYDMVEYRRVRAYLKFRSCTIVLPMQRQFRIGTSPLCDIVLEEKDKVEEMHTCFNLTALGVLVTNLTSVPGATGTCYGPLAEKTGRFIQVSTKITFGEEMAELVLPTKSCLAIRTNIGIFSVKFTNYARPDNFIPFHWRVEHPDVLVLRRPEEENALKCTNIVPFGAAQGEGEEERSDSESDDVDSD